MITNNAILANKYYYDKSNCRLALCDSCWQFATILKDVYEINNNCTGCKKKEQDVFRKNNNIVKQNHINLNYFFLTLYK